MRTRLLDGDYADDSDHALALAMFRLVNRKYSSQIPSGRIRMVKDGTQLECHLDRDQLVINTDSSRPVEGHGIGAAVPVNSNGKLMPVLREGEHVMT